MSEISTKPTTAWAEVDENGHLILPPEVARQYGLHPGSKVRLDEGQLVLTLKGTPFLYNGEEIGMTDYIIMEPDRLRDTTATWYYESLVNELHVPAEEAARRAGEMTRDKNRTPMQWSSQPNAGFSPADVQTWLPVNPDYKRGINVRDQEHNPSSLLNYYRLLLKVRKQNPALIVGDYLPVHTRSDEYMFAKLDCNAGHASSDTDDQPVSAGRVLLAHRYSPCNGIGNQSPGWRNHRGSYKQPNMAGKVHRPGCTKH